MTVGISGACDGGATAQITLRRRASRCASGRPCAGRATAARSNRAFAAARNHNCRSATAHGCSRWSAPQAKSKWRRRISCASSMPVMPGITTSENTTSKPSAFRGQLGQRIGGVADQRGGVAEFVQRVACKGSDLEIVLDHEHRHAAAVDRRRGFGRHRLRAVVGGDTRQIQRERAAPADFAVPPSPRRRIAWRNRTPATGRARCPGRPPWW